MSKGFRRRDVLGAGAAAAASAVAGCFEEARNPGEDNTPSPTPEAKPMEPFDATHGGRFASTDPIEHGIYDRINEARRTRSIETLSWDANLAYVARTHSRDMHKRDFYAHTNPDGEGPATRMREYGLDSYLASVGEIIAKRPLRDHTEDLDIVARRFFESWKASESHWSEILESDQDRLGVGVYISEDRWMYGTCMFGNVEPNRGG